MARKLLWHSGIRPEWRGRSSRCFHLRHLTSIDRQEASGIDMRHKTTQALYAYWNEMRGERIAPQRLEIQPARIGAVLPDTFILERCDSRTYRYRLAGTRVCACFGMELRSLNFLDRWTPGDRALLEEHLAAITETGRAGVFTGEALGIKGPAATFEIVILPLVHTGNAIDRYLCAISVFDEPGWLGDEPIRRMRLGAAEAIWPRGQSLAAVSGNQEPLLPHVRHGRIVRQQRRQFRVYDGGLSGGQDKH
jgi:hypothetical protein